MACGRAKRRLRRIATVELRNGSTAFRRHYVTRLIAKTAAGRKRPALYLESQLPTMSKGACSKKFASRLKKNGKAKMQIVCAAMRKLLHQAFGVSKNTC